MSFYNLFVTIRSVDEQIHFNNIGNIATLFRSPIYTLHGVLCVQYNVKLCCLFSGWFAKEAIVAKQRLANFGTLASGDSGTHPLNKRKRR